MLTRLILIIAGLLALAFVVGPSPGAGHRPAPLPLDPPAEPANVADAKLRQMLTAVHFDKTPLFEAFAQVGKQADINLLIYRASIVAAGVDPALPISIDLKNVTADEALQVLEAMAGEPTARLTHYSNGNLLIVSTADHKTMQSATTRIYDMIDLVQSEQRRYTMMWPPDHLMPHTDVGGQMPTVPFDYSTWIQDIVKLIQETVDAESWQEQGGMTGAIKELNGRVIVIQTPENHRKIERLLKLLRETGGPVPVVESSAKPQGLK